MAVDPKTSRKPNSPTQPGLRFGEPEKRNWVGIAVLTTFIVIGILAAAWMWVASPKLHSLSCDTSSGNGSMTSFGGCHEN